MPRFNGIPVDEPLAKGPRFKGIPIDADPSQQDSSLSAENAVRSAASGVPIIGGMLNKIDAATNATLAPAIDPLLPDSFQKLPSQTWDERYQRALDIQNAKDSAFENEHPYVDTGLNVAGAVGGIVPAIMASPAAFGAGGGGLIGRTLASGASGAAIGGADSAVRSEGDPLLTAKGLIGGGAAGLIGPVAGKVIGAGWQRLRDFRAARAAAQASGVDRGTLSTIGRAVRDDGLDPAAIGQRMATASLSGDYIDGISIVATNAIDKLIDARDALKAICEEQAKGGAK